MPTNAKGTAMIREQLRNLAFPTRVLAAGILLSSFAGGCANTGAKRVETGGPETIRTVEHIDDQDWSEAATKLTKSMLNTEGLLSARPDGGKRLLAIDRIVNNPGE